jgi:flagellar motor protein MotB
VALREQEEEEGEGYFASVSDLMVGILFVFLLMLTVFALNYREAEQKQEVSRAELDAAKEKARLQTARADRLWKQLKDAAAQLQRDIEASSNARDRLLAKLETALQEHGIPVRVDWQAGVLHLHESVLFQPTDASLGPEQRKKVGSLADALTRILPCFTAPSERTPCEQPDLTVLETVLIEGHTDKRPIISGRYRDNDQLSTERALAVFGELLRVQPNLEALRNADNTYPLLGVSGFGARRPLPEAQGETEADYAPNRRIDLRFLLARTAELDRLRSQIQAALNENEQ